LRAAKGTRLARMSGSGATCFAIFGSDDHAQAAAQAIRNARPNWWVHAGTLS
jgi:4-diphosphocytidyl-2-C-methyl-D-erythritol kinase